MDSFKESNVKLSDDRAKAIKNFFIDSCHVNNEMIETYALGESNPVADNNTEEGREKNRRVEIIVFPDANPVKDDVVGVWKTVKRGEIHIYKYGDVIAGWYESNGGEILGTLIDKLPLRENGLRMVRQKHATPMFMTEITGET